MEYQYEQQKEEKGVSQNGCQCNADFPGGKYGGSPNKE